MNQTARPGPFVCVVGARPNFMKIAPLLRAFAQTDLPRPLLVHTGQHYDDAMKGTFFRDLDIPEPDVDLGVGSGSHGVQTAEVMKRFEAYLSANPTCGVIVVGDVNSTLACALVAAKRLTPVIHVEAGLRSFDRTMPEEINRVLTDQISDLLFTTERQAAVHLSREGIAVDRVHFVGNVMIDSLFHCLAKAPSPRAVFQQVLGESAAEALVRDGYALLTLHRPSNVDDPAVLKRLIGTVVELARDMPFVFPVHPRTRAKIDADGQLQELLQTSAITRLPPVGYLEMVALMRTARCVLTDSGGIQEETTALGVPCITLREQTERPITVEEGTNTIAGTDAQRIRAAWNRSLDQSNTGQPRRPDFWDGNAAQRIVGVLTEWLS